MFSCRQKTLKCINCRPFLLAICALVVVECACVLAELMIDLQGIKFRFENEETEINRFALYLREKHPDIVSTEDMRTMADVINLLERSIALRSPKELLEENFCACMCPCSNTSAVLETRMETNSSETKPAVLQSVMLPLDGARHANLSPKLVEENISHLESTTKPLEIFGFSNFFTSSSLVPRPALTTSKSSPPFSAFLEKLNFSWHETVTSTPLPYLLSSASHLKSSKVLSKQTPSNETTMKLETVYSAPSKVNTFTSASSKTPESLTQLSMTQDGFKLLHSTPFPSSSNLNAETISNANIPDLINVGVPTEGYTIDSDNSVPTKRPHPETVTVPHKLLDESTDDTSFTGSALSPSTSISSQRNEKITATHSRSIAHSPKHASLTHVPPKFSGVRSKSQFSIVLPRSAGSLSSNEVEGIKSANETLNSVPSSSTNEADLGSSLQVPLNTTGFTNSQSLKQISSAVGTLDTTNNSSVVRPISLQDIFVLEINNVIDSFFLVAEFVPEHNSVNRTKFIQNTLEYSKIYKASKALHFISLSILSVMVLETAVKLFCTGWAFFKKKFEVFDAFIVVSSFALDFVFLDSRWYETGKDATTILVLLLPWRVVRIVNSFLMTMKHKHYLQMMNMKRAKKKAELKSAKLQTLLSEIRKDVQLLVVLCKSHEIDEKDITACLYGKGRRGVTMSAMSTCTSLMLISTLGKDAVQEDDIYGKVFKEALNEGDETELDAEILQAEEAAIDAAIQLDEQFEARKKSKKYKSKKSRVKRSYTVPRRTASVEIPEADINENSNNIFYINDGYFHTQGSSPRPSEVVMLGTGPDFTKITGAVASCSSVDEETEGLKDDSTTLKQQPTTVSAQSKYESMASVRSLPGRGSKSNSMVIYLPGHELDEKFQIPNKIPRKQERSIHFYNI